MSMSDVITTLHDFLTRWLTDAGFRDEYDGDLDAAMDEHGLDDVDPAELMECLPLVAEDLPLAYQRSVFDYMNTVNAVNTGGHTVQQGGSTTTATTGTAEGTAAVAASAQQEPLPGEDPAEAVVRHITNIQNVYETNYSYIEDNDVVNTITADGDVNLDQNVASGDGAFAGDNAEGVVQGDNYGINAGDDVDDAQVNNVDGDGNVVGNEIGEDANVVTGDVGGNFVDGDVDDSALVGGDNYGQALGDVDDSVVTGGDSGIAVAGDNADADLDDVNVNVGDGQQFNIDGNNQAVGFGEGDVSLDQSIDQSQTDNSVNIDDSYNTDNSIDDSYNTQDNSVTDSYNEGSYNEVDIDQSSHVDYDVDDGSTGGDVDTTQQAASDISADDDFGEELPAL